MRKKERIIFSLKSVRKLIESWRSGSEFKKIGNHSFFLSSVNGEACFCFFGNMVVRVHKNRTYTVDYCGYEGYSSTTRTINSYRQELRKLGYKENKKRIYLVLNKRGTGLKKEPKGR